MLRYGFISIGKAKRNEFGRQITAKGKFAGKTMIEIMVGVREFCFGYIVFMVAVFVCEFLCQMPE